MTACEVFDLCQYNFETLNIMSIIIKKIKVGKNNKYIDNKTDNLFLIIAANNTTHMAEKKLAKNI